MQRNHKWLHDQLPCDLERVDAAEAAEADDKELPGIEQDGGHRGAIGAKERIGAAAACPAAAAAASGDRWGASRSTRASTAAAADALGARQSIVTHAYVPAEELRASGYRYNHFAAADDDNDDDDSGGGSSCAEHSVPSWDKADPDFDDGTTTPMPIHANVTAAARSSRLSLALAPAADTVEKKHEVDKYDTHHGQQLQPLLDAVGLSHTPWRCDVSIVTEGTWSCWWKGPLFSRLVREIA